MCLRIVVRTSISNHHPSGKRKKPKPRHNAPCLRQLVRYKLYEIRLDTLKKRRYAPAEPTIIVAFPFAIVKSSSHSLYAKKIQPPYPHICDNIIADFPKISSSFQNTTLHSNKYDKIFRYDTPGNVFLFVYLAKKESQTQDSSYAISNSFSPSKIIIRIAGPAAFRICPHLVAQHAQKQHPGQQEKPDQDSYDR